MENHLKVSITVSCNLSGNPNAGTSVSHTRTKLIDTEGNLGLEIILVISNAVIYNQLLQPN